MEVKPRSKVGQGTARARAGGSLGLRLGVPGAPRGSRAGPGSQGPFLPARAGQARVAAEAGSAPGFGHLLGMATDHGQAGTLAYRWGSGSRPMRGTRVRSSPGWQGRAMGTGMGRGQAGTSTSGVGPAHQGPWLGRPGLWGWRWCPTATLGQAVVAPGAGMGSWAVGRVGGALGASRDIRAPECTQGPCRVSPVLSA